MTNEKNHVVVTVSGRDRPGITAAFSRILVDHGVEIADIDQATLQDFLALTFLLELDGADEKKDSVLKDLLFDAHRLDMDLSFQLLSEVEVRRKQEKNLFVLTFFGGTKPLADISAVLGEERANIVKISNLSRGTADCIELLVNVKEVASISALKDRVMTVGHTLGVDVAIQRLESYRKGKRIVFFDMDRTLVDAEAIDEMARAAGVAEELTRVTEKAMRGDLDFEHALQHRVALLKGLEVSMLEEIRDNLKVSEGADTLVATLKKLGYTLGVVSGGFHFFADALKDRLGLDFAYANRLEIEDKKLTGRVLEPIIDGTEKAKILNRVASERGIQLDQTVAIGDGANDQLMLGQAGLGIAYNARRALERSAGMTLGKTKLTNILYILGITERDVEEI
jgi:phosphoserine phosphatase